MSKYKKHIIYIIFTLIIIILTLCNLSGKEYKVMSLPGITKIQEIDENKIAHDALVTDKITLTKGSYQFIINYSSDTDTAINVCIGRDDIATDILAANSDSGYHVMNISVPHSTSEFYFKISDSENLNIYNYEITKKDGYIVYDDIYYAILILISLLVIFFVLNNYWKERYTKKTVVTFFILTAITVFVSSPIFNNYMVYGFDLYFHLSRIEGIKDAFLDGQIIPVIYPNCNNGYGVLGFMYPFLFLIPPALLRMLNVSMVASYHFFILMTNIITVTIAWISSRTFTKSHKTSILCVLLCACNPLRLTSLYQSAAVGTVLGMAFMPLVFAGLYEIIYNNKKKWYYLTIALTGIMMSHILSCIIVTIILSINCITSLKKLIDKTEKRYIYLIISIAAFLVVNSYYIIKFISFYRYSLNSEFIFNDHYYKDTIIPTKLFMMDTTNMVSPQAEKGVLDGCIQGPGLAGLICLFIMLIDLVLCNTEDFKQKNWLKTNVSIIVISIYISTSMFPWFKTTQIGILNKFMGTVQFPYRFYYGLSPLIFIFGVLSLESLINRYEKKLTDMSFFVYPLMIYNMIIIFSIITCYTTMDTYNRSEPVKTVYSGGYASYPLIEYLPRETDTSVFDNKMPHNFGSTLSYYHQNGTKAEFECQTFDEGAYILLPMLYYPGYTAIGENKESYKIGRCPDGRIQVFMPVTDQPQKIFVSYKP